MENNCSRLSLLLLVTVSLSQGFIYTERALTGWKGSSVRLPCVFSVTPIALFWGKGNASDLDSPPANKAKYFDNEISSDSRFTLDGTDYSLTIEDLRVSDEGVYICHVTDESIDEKNYTILTVNAKAKRHFIKQCEDRSTDTCTHQASHKYPNFNLDCTIEGFKPNVTLTWRDSSGTPLIPLGKPTQTLLEDGTWDRTVTISVVAKNGTEQNLTCEAEGAAVDEGSVVSISVLALPGAEPVSGPGSNGLSAGAAAVISILFIILVCLVVLGLLILADRKNKLPTKVSLVIQMIPFVKKKPTAEEVEEMRRLDEQEAKKQQRKELRDKIKSYTPGTAANIDLPESVSDIRPNINMFGQMSAGKSTFLNSLSYAITGEYKVVFEVGDIAGAGGKTRERLQLQIKDTKFNLIDNRGMQSFSLDFMDSVNEQLRGERGVNPDDTIVKLEYEECHCPVFAYHDAFVSGDARKEAFAFINKFSEEIHEYYGRSPMVVITHKGELQQKSDLKSIKNRLAMYNIPPDNIWAFESYTRDNNKEDIDKDIELLNFLWQALDYCDRNLSHIARKRGETVINIKPKPKEQKKDRNKVVYERVIHREETAKKSEESKSSGCVVM